MFRFFRRKATPAPAPAAAIDDDRAAFEAADALQDAAADAPPSVVPEPVVVQPAASEPAGAAPPSGMVAAAEAALEVVEPPAPVPAAREGWMSRLRAGLRRTGGSIAQVFSGARSDDEVYEDLESALLMADVGVAATKELLDDLKRRAKKQGAHDPQALRGLLIDALADMLAPLERSFDVGRFVPTVIMVAGVNGAGKTTSIGKLTRHLAQAGCKVLLAAADTFRAAAKEQLAVWADRTRVEIIAQEGGDPAAVAYDAVVAGAARGCDVVIVDTAGRLATQANLMDELRKIRRTVNKAQPGPLGTTGLGAPHEALLVVDGNTGQNALAQARAFDEAIELTGLIVTKLDGTAKGGVLAALALWARERQRADPARRPIAVYFIGVGETLADLERFDAREFAQALLD